MFYEFNEELHICTRVALDGPGARKPSLPLEAGANDDDLIVARWVDGHKHEVPGLTTKRLRMLNRRTTSSTGELWVGSHVETRHKAHIWEFSPLVV